MPFLDLDLAELRHYRPPVAEPADFDDFWQRTLAESRQAAGEVRVEPVDAGLTAFDTYDVTFPGFAGDPVKAWFTVPAHATGPLPTVVGYNGYGGGRGLPHERLAWPAAGYAYLFMDTRGQGAGWGSGGQTADPHGSGPAIGFMTQGIEDPAGYFYRRLFTDAVRAVETVRGFEQVDPARVAVTGGSQGGGMTIAVAGLVPGLMAAMPDVPFLSHIRRSVGMTDQNPYAEVVQYLSVHRGRDEQVFETLSYFDGVNFARRATAPALFSVALMDPICPPSGVFASINHWAATAEVEVYAYNEHEGGGEHQWARQAAWLGAITAGRDADRVQGR
jgi:cephalosporin-C deacetylase